MTRLSTTTLLVAASVLGALTLPAEAARAPRPQIVDPVGDANGVNGQAFGLPVPSVSTPVDATMADILSVRFSTVFKKVGRKRVPKGMQVVMTLADAPQTGFYYAVSATVPKTCDGAGTTLALAHLDEKVTHVDTVSCEDTSNVGSTTNLGTDVVVDAAAHTVTWTFDPGLPVGTRFTDITADTSAFVVGVYDDAASATPYVYGR
jgi:hypothetical protein